MPAFQAGATVVPIMREDIDHTVDEIGTDRTRMVDGSMRQLEGVRKGVWRLTTKLLTLTEINTTYLPALLATPPVSCQGDILGATINCFIQITNITRHPLRGVIKHRIHFTVFEQ